MIKAFLLFTGTLFLTGCLLMGCMSQKQPTNKYYLIEKPDSIGVLSFQKELPYHV